MTALLLVLWPPQDTVDFASAWAHRAVGEPLGGAGHRVGVWDFNRDGFDDLVIAEPGADRVWIFYGPIKEDTLDLLWPSGDYTLIYGPAEDSVGYSFAAGDFDSDGWLDLALASYQNGPYAVYIVFGPMADRREVDLSHPEEQRVIRFANFPWYSDAGHSLAAGDFNGDGFDDLAIGAPKASVNYLAKNGEVFIAWGREVWDSVIIVDAWRGVSPIIGGDDYQYVGMSLAAGDFNGDGLDDLAIGWPGYSLVPNAGGVLVLMGADTQWFDTLNLLWQWWPGSKLIVGSQAFSQLGASLAAGDLDGDGLDDLAAGAPKFQNEEPNSGAVFVIPGPLPDTLRLGEDTGFFFISWVNQNSFLGRTLAFGDLDGAGGEELILGAPLLNWEGRDFAGGVWILGWPLPDTLDLWRAPAGCVFLVGGENYKLGEGLAVGDVDGDGKRDLVLGAPWANAFKTRFNAGFAIWLSDTVLRVVEGKPEESSPPYAEIYDVSGRLLWRGKGVPPRFRNRVLIFRGGRKAFLLPPK